MESILLDCIKDEYDDLIELTQDCYYISDNAIKIVESKRNQNIKNFILDNKNYLRFYKNLYYLKKIKKRLKNIIKILEKLNFEDYNFTKEDIITAQNFDLNRIIKF